LRLRRKWFPDNLLDPNTIGRERDRIAIVADQCVDVGLGRGDAVVVGNAHHRIARLLLIALRALHRRRA
jgi:hypothetical protein